MLQLQGQTQRRQKANSMPAPSSHGASAESTERDQLAGERNVRDADSSVIATDHSGAQQHAHTADYWLHIYTPMWLCLHFHAEFRAVIVKLHLKTYPVPGLAFDAQWQKYSLPKVLLLVLLPLFLSKILMIVCLFLCIHCADIICQTVRWQGEIRYLLPSTHLLAGHLASHLKKEKQNNITVKNDNKISCSISFMKSAQNTQNIPQKGTLTYFSDILSQLSCVIFVLDDRLLMLLITMKDLMTHHLFALCLV